MLIKIGRSLLQVKSQCLQVRLKKTENDLKPRLRFENEQLPSEREERYYSSKSIYVVCGLFG
jgi:hypothetical protein